LREEGGREKREGGRRGRQRRRRTGDAYLKKEK